MPFQFLYLSLSLRSGRFFFILFIKYRSYNSFIGIRMLFPILGVCFVFFIIYFKYKTIAKFIKRACHGDKDRKRTLNSIYQPLIGKATAFYVNASANAS